MEQGYGEQPPADEQHRVSDLRGTARDDHISDQR